jgi:hypothetical protein
MDYLAREIIAGPGEIVINNFKVLIIMALLRDEWE